MARRRYTSRVRYLTAAEAAEHAGVSRMQIYRWVERSWLPGWESESGHLLVRLDDLDQLLGDLASDEQDEELEEQEED